MSKTSVRRELSTDRIEGFSDGVFAIVATLLVLEVKLPRSVADVAGGSKDSVEAGVANG